MQPADEAEGWDEEEEAAGNDEGDGGDYTDEEEEEAERVIEIVDRRLKRLGGAHASATAAPVEELLVKRRGYAKAVWMDSAALIESGRLAVSMLRAFERKQKAANDQAHKISLTAHVKAPTAKPKPKQAKGKRAKTADVAYTDATGPPSALPTPHPLDDPNLVILFPQREADFGEDSLKMELEENVPLRNQLCKHLRCSRVQDMTFATARGGFNSFSFTVSNGNEHIFVKVNTNRFALEMFEAETAGLQLYRQHAKDMYIVPEVVSLIPLKRREGAVLVLQYLPVRQSISQDRTRLARKLATIHSTRIGNSFGCPFDTYWASVRQPAGACDAWPDFIVNFRFRPILNILRHAPDYEEVIFLTERVLSHIDKIFADIPPGGIVPVLVHGDLGISANWSAVNDTIAFYDMVPMFGHSEMDLIKLGEAHDFRTEYERTLPPRPNIHLRREFYLLYFELVKLRTAFGIQRTAKNCFHMLRSLLQSLEPEIVRDMPLGSDLPLMKLRAPSNPSSASNYVLFFGGSFSPVHLNHLSVLQSCREWIEKHKKGEVLGGWLCPSTDYHLSRKLTEGGLPRGTRLTAITLACMGTPWAPMAGTRSPALQPAFIRESVLKALGWHVTVVMLYGADNFRWAAKFLATGEVVMVTRRNRFDDELAEALARVPEAHRSHLFVNDEWVGPDVSSSRVRSALKAGDWAAVRAMVPPGVVGVLRDAIAHAAP